MSKKYADDIDAITAEIEKQCGREGNVDNLWHLYYQRGYFYFLDNEDDLAKDDYRQAQKLGLDVTEYPYYSFSNSNSKRRELLLPEKILVVLILIMVLVAMVFQVLSFLSSVKIPV